MKACPIRAGWLAALVLGWGFLALPAGAGALEPDPRAPEATPLQLPHSPAGEALAAWLELVNAGERAAIAAFVGRRFSPELMGQIPMEAMTVFHLNLLQEHGELRPLSVEEASDHEIRILARGEGENRLQITLSVAPEPPHSVTGLRVVPPEEKRPERVSRPHQEAGGDSPAEGIDLPEGSGDSEPDSEEEPTQPPTAPPPR